jgi:hypothetical protein
MPHAQGWFGAVAGREASQGGLSLGPLRERQKAARVLPRGVREGRGPGRDPGGATPFAARTQRSLTDESGQERLGAVS